MKTKDLGWISLYRNIKDHWIFENDKWFKWWVIILFEVNHSESKITLGYNVHELKEGQSAKSIRTWANLFNCGTKQATNFFNLLESDNMITRKILGKGKQSTTLISITKYAEYQGQEKRKRHSKGNAEETQEKRKRHTDNNYNNYNKTISGEKDFLEDWGKCRKSFRNLPTNIPKLTTMELSIFNELAEDYSREQMREAMRGLFQQEVIKFSTMITKPRHFLEHFETYYNAFLSKDSKLYGKKEIQH